MEADFFRTPSSLPSMFKAVIMQPCKGRARLFKNLNYHREIPAKEPLKII